MGFLLLWAGGCTPSDALQTVQHQQVFRISLPEWLTPMPSLNEEAPFCYGNRQHSFFLLARYDSLRLLNQVHPSFGLEDYYDYHLERLIAPLQDVQAPAPDSSLIANCPTLVGSFTGIFKKDDLQYHLMLIQDQVWLYQVLVWYPMKDEEHHGPLTEDMLKSFQPASVMERVQS